MKTLDSVTAMGPGSPVWMIADLESSKWARQIDWLLNHQVLRAETHKSPPFSNELNEVMNMWEFEPPRVSVGTTSPLMVASESLLPNSQTVSVAYTGDVKAWAAKCNEIWRGLNQPNLRVFLPDSVDADAFMSAWPAADRSDSIEIVGQKGSLPV